MLPSRPNKNRKIPIVITPALLRSWPLPSFEASGGKDERGRALIIGGSREIPGSIILSARAALRSGTGKLQLGAVKSIASGVALMIPESRTMALDETARGCVKSAPSKSILASVEHADAVLVGPGMVAGDALLRYVWQVAARVRPSAVLVLDAAALRCARNGARMKTLGCGGIITPHAGEMADILECSKADVEKDRASMAQTVAGETGLVVVLKGRETVIALADGTSYLNRAGNAGLAISGSGDALAGMITGLAARGATAEQAAIWGVALHAYAGENMARLMGPLGYRPSEVIDQIPSLMHRFSKK